MSAICLVPSYRRDEDQGSGSALLEELAHDALCDEECSQQLRFLDLESAWMRHTYIDVDDLPHLGSGILMEWRFSRDTGACDAGIKQSETTLTKERESGRYDGGPGQSNMLSYSTYQPSIVPKSRTML